MPAEFNNASSTNGNASSYTFGHDATGSDILLVQVSSKTSTYPLVSSVTFNGAGNPLVQCTGALFGSVMVGELWCLENPPSASGNVVVTLVSSTKAVCGAVSYNNVSGLNFDTLSVTTGQNSGGSGNIATAVNDSVVFLGWSSRDGRMAVTIDPDLTERYDDRVTGNPAGNQAIGKGLDEGSGVGLSAGTYAYGFTQDAVEAWVVICAELVPLVASDESNFGFIL